MVIVKSLKSVCPVLVRNMDKLHSVVGAAKTNDVFKDVQKGSDQYGVSQLDLTPDGHGFSNSDH